MPNSSSLRQNGTATLQLLQGTRMTSTNCKSLSYNIRLMYTKRISKQNQSSVFKFMFYSSICNNSGHVHARGHACWCIYTYGRVYFKVTYVDGIIQVPLYPYLDLVRSHKSLETITTPGLIKHSMILGTVTDTYYGSIQVIDASLPTLWHK